MKFKVKNIALPVPGPGLLPAFFILLFSLVGLKTGAQDIHFSQFYAAPLLVNPANTGISGDGIRISNIYRNQWSKIGNPFQTISTSIDGNLKIGGQTFGIGGLVLHDQSSAFNLSANGFRLSFSYSKMFGNHQFTFGLQPGYVLKSYNLQGMTFNSQFSDITESFDPSLPALESGLGDRLSYFDLNAGVMWRTMIKNIMPMAGISVDHINMPVQRFSTASSGTRLHVKLNITAGVVVPLNDRIMLNPLLIYSYTPGTNEFLAGSVGDYSLGKNSTQVKKVYALVLIRVNPVRNLDAFILGGGAEFYNFNLGISYDLNISPLSKVTNFKGGFEVTLVFKLKGDGKNGLVLPCYIIN
jgi:type IX secretion system PorP/SprF family membrane protein